MAFPCIMNKVTCVHLLWNEQFGHSGFKSASGFPCSILLALPFVFKAFNTCCRVMDGCCLPMALYKLIFLNKMFHSADSGNEYVGFPSAITRLCLKQQRGMLLHMGMFQSCILDQENDKCYCFTWPGQNVCASLSPRLFVYLLPPPLHFEQQREITDNNFTKEGKSSQVQRQNSVSMHHIGMNSLQNGLHALELPHRKHRRGNEF